MVFALIDSLTMQSSFSGVRLESYMFTEESFRAVRDRLAPDGLLVVYNYFREQWLVDRLANTAAAAFGQEPRVHVHEARAYLGVHDGRPAAGDADGRPVDSRSRDGVRAVARAEPGAHARARRRRSSRRPTTGRFSTCATRHVPRHYLAALALVLVVSDRGRDARRCAGRAGTWSWQFFLLGAGFMLLETKSIIQFALLWGSTWVVASLAIASVLSMALVANYVVSKVEIRRPWLVGRRARGAAGAELR